MLAFPAHQVREGFNLLPGLLQSRLPNEGRLFLLCAAMAVPPVPGDGVSLDLKIRFVGHGTLLISLP
jgi:hypothetical protein